MKEVEQFNTITKTIKDEWVSEIGKRITFNAEIGKVVGGEGDYGPWTLITFIDEESRKLNWFASGVHEYEIGTKVKVKGTIKKHDMYKDLKVTMISRCKVEVI